MSSVTAPGPAPLSNSTIDPPQAFLCPISYDVMVDPVIDPSGTSYEKNIILQWLLQNSTSPVTQRQLRPKQLIPNQALQTAIHEFMGPEWVEQKKAESAQEESQQESTTTDASSPPSQIVGLSPYRRRVDSFLEDVSRTVGKNIRLNSQGICAFTYEHMTVVIEVPETVGSFFLYSSLLTANKAHYSPSRILKIYDKCMELNYLQQETRGACLSLDPINNEVMISYTDRISEINSTDFRNILENYIDTILNLCKVIRDIAKEVDEEEAAATNHTSNPTIQDQEAQPQEDTDDDSVANLRRAFEVGEEDENTEE